MLSLALETVDGRIAGLCLSTRDSAQTPAMLIWCYGKNGDVPNWTAPLANENAAIRRVRD